MKPLFNLIVLIVFILILSFQGSNRVFKERGKCLPIPTGVVSRNAADIDNDKEREAWIEKMHRIEPGKSWQQQDMQSRIARQAQRLKFKRKSFGNWVERGSNNQAGRIHLAEYDSTTNTIYAASSGGNIWKSKKDGSNWTCLNDVFRLPEISMLRVIKHNGGKRLLVASKGFFYSDNEGNTWKESTGLENFKTWGGIFRALVANDERRTIYLISSEWNYTDWYSQTTIYKSINQGESFLGIITFPSGVYGSSNNFDIWTDYYKACPLYIMENNNIHLINDKDSISFVGSLPALPDSSSKYLTGCRTTTGTYLYALVNKNWQSRFYASSDGGVKWTTKGSVPDSPFMINSFACSQMSPDKLFIGGQDCYRSYDSGETWETVNTWDEYYSNPSQKLHADIPGINFFISNGNEFGLIGTDGGLYISNDNLQTVNNLSLNKLNVSQYYSTYTCRTNTAIVHAGSQDQGYQKTINNTGTGILDFEQVISGDYGHIVSANKGKSIWMVYPGSLEYYPDINIGNYSVSWNFYGNIYGQLWMPPLMEDPENASNVYLAGGSNTSGSKIIKLSSDGYTITSREGNFDFSDGNGDVISAMAYSPIIGNLMERYVLTAKGKFYMSTDNGTNWTKTNSFTGPTNEYFYGSCILASKIQDGKVYIAGSGYSNPPVYVSTDHGNSFSSISGLPNTMVYSLAANADESRIYAATELGPYVYVVSENKWYDLYDGIAPDQVYWSVEYIDETKTARFGTYGRGIWDFNESDTLGIADISVKEFSVFPNPAKDKLYVRSASKLASVKVFSSKGEEVYFKNNYPENGIDIKNLSEGVYYLQAKTSKGEIFRKFIKSN